MQGLSILVQEGLGRDRFAGDVFVFRGRGGSLIKALWARWTWTVALCQALDRGRFVWLGDADGERCGGADRGAISYLLEAIDWRNPRHTWRPQSVLRLRRIHYRFVPLVSESSLPAAVTVEFLGTRLEVRGTPGLVLSDLVCRSDGHVHTEATRALMIYVATQPVDFRNRAVARSGPFVLETPLTSDGPI